MAYSEEMKLRIQALLSMGEMPMEIAEKYDVPYVTIQGWKKKLEKASSEDAKVEKLVKTDPIILQGIVDKLETVAPSDVVKKAQKLVDGVTGLQQLEPKFHAIVFNLLDMAEKMMSAVDEDDGEPVVLSIKDWTMLSNGIGTLYTNIFNKSGVNVNVMNQTTVNSEKVSLFKSQMRG